MRGPLITTRPGVYVRPRHTPVPMRPPARAWAAVHEPALLRMTVQVRGRPVFVGVASFPDAARNRQKAMICGVCLRDRPSTPSELGRSPRSMDRRPPRQGAAVSMSHGSLQLCNAALSLPLQLDLRTPTVQRLDEFLQHEQQLRRGPCSLFDRITHNDDPSFSGPQCYLSRSVNRAPTAPSNRGNVQINAVAISKSDATSQTCRYRECVTGLGRADMNVSWS